MSFDTLAPFYRTMEFLSAGGKLQECRTAFLKEIPSPENILIAGEGHGRFLPLCAERFPEARITVIDASSAMLEIARRKVASDKIRFLHVDVLKWEGPPGAFDLVVTHFFLDCFPPEELAVVVARLAESATPDAHWLLADFQVPDGRAASLRSRLILALLYSFFRLVTGLRASALAPPEKHLEEAGFVRHRRITRDWGLLKSEWWRRKR
ncbi:MAG: class I SAM-dependent methyltransferase [Verrucomicrobiaceae bacterium]|nr:MAG: class I SAM-dependent methyltransferase [Verrucomicrobiaceae bacterium]